LLGLSHIELDAMHQAELGIVRAPDVLRRRVVAGTELWNGNVEGGWRESITNLIWPAFRRALENRRTVPKLVERHPHLDVHRLRSDRDVRTFVDVLRH